MKNQYLVNLSLLQISHKLKTCPKYLICRKNNTKFFRIRILNLPCLMIKCKYKIFKHSEILNISFIKNIYYKYKVFKNKLKDRTERRPID